MLDNKPLKSKTNRACSIAIVGLSGRFPGGANSPDELWDVLISGRDAVTESKGDRWDIGWHNDDQDRSDRIYTKAFGSLDQIDKFDADFFGISPREAQQIDPQQRLLLELAWEVFEAAGMSPRGVAGENIGVYVGISSNDYAQLAADGGPDAYSNTGSAFSIAANRLSYVFDLHGPSFAVDTACSSSLVCLHQAAQAVQSGECDAALAGGVSILMHTRPWLGFARASMLSPDGRCKSFDESGNGYVRSEGGGLVLLKRLEDAEADGDNILGVLRATGINSDGRTMGLSMPNGEAQTALLDELYDEANIDAERVFYVEAHGTGTSVGDPIECGALGKVLGAPRADGSVCHIGSIKSNIGHLEPASGIAGLAKVLLSLKHRQIPANLHYNTPNPKIKFDEWRLQVVDTALPLPKEPVVIGINSFGFGGTNAHAIVEEYCAPAVEETLETPKHLILSANSEGALREIARSYADLLRMHGADLTTIAHAAATCRAPLRMRLAVTATNAAEAAKKLDAWCDDAPLSGTASGVAEDAQVPTAFVFSGNGPQWWGMGRELLAENDIFRAKIEEVDAIFQPLAGWSLLDEMAKPEEEERIARTEVAQPMLFAQQMALTAVLDDADISPAAVFGHSVGEVAAACASGALTLEQATKVIFYRSREQSRTAGIGKMAALGLDKAAAETAISNVGGWLEIAAINGPGAVTVAGDETFLAKLAAQVTENGKFARVLKLDYPFHTNAMEVIKEDLVAALNDIKPTASIVPFISTVTGKTLEGETLDAEYWFQNVRQPVNFHGAVESLLSDHGIGLFIEIGPHPVLKDYIGQTIRAAGTIATALETLRRPSRDRLESDVENLAQAIAAAHSHGASVLDDIYTRPARLPDLPVYKWQRERHWRGEVPLPDSFIATKRVHPLLGARLPATDGKWEVPLDKGAQAYLKDHVVQDAVLFPAAGYLEMMLAAARQQWGEETTIDVENLQIMRPLVLSDQGDPIVQTVIDKRDGTLEISSRRDIDAQEQLVHIRGRLSNIEDCKPKKIDIKALIQRMPVAVDALSHYTESHRRGLQYGPFFQGVQEVRLTAEDAQTREALAKINLDFLKEGGLENYRAHPSLFDSCIQAIIPLIAQVDKRNVSTIPVSFDRIRSFIALPPELLCHVCIIRESERSVVANFTVMATDGSVLLELNGARCQKANLTGEMESPFTSEWWRPDTTAVKTDSLPALPTPTKVVAAPAAASYSRQTLDFVAQSYILKALDTIRPADPTFTMGTIARHARIGRAQGALLTQMLDIAVESGHITQTGKTWTWGDAPLGDVETIWADAFRNHPSHQAELLLLAEIGESLVDRLTGEDLFEPNAALIEQLNDTAPFAAETNQLTIATIQSMVDAWPEDRPMRILEVCGGTGGLASWILPILPAERTDYLFTDPSEALVAKVERRLSMHNFMRTSTLDLAKDFFEQGLTANYFDLVIGTKLYAHNGRTPTFLNTLQSVMADGGKLCVVGPQEGAAAALLQNARLELNTSTLEKSGFTQATSLKNGSAELLIGTSNAKAQMQAPVSEPETIFIVAEKTAGFAQKFAQELSDLGHTAQVVDFPQETGEVAVETLQEALNDAEPSNVILLSDPQTDANVHDVQVKRTLIAAALTRAMEMVRQDFECTLSIVTRGGFATANGAGPVDPFEAALFGMGRVIGNEYPLLDVRLIDMHGDDAKTLATEISRRDDETEVQLLDGHRYVNRERITTPADEAKYAGLKADAYALDFTPKGGLDSLHLRKLTRQSPTGDGIEIAVKAAGLNFRDVLWCMGMLPEEAVEHGFSGPTIGMECAGEVVSVGPDVTHVKPGDRVMAFASSCFGTHVTTAAKSVAKMPSNMSYSEAATVPTVFLTAWYGLDYLARIEEGETILIHGAAGGVGLAAIQIAKQKGATIIGTAGSPMKRRMLELLGVDYVLNSRTLEYADQVMEITEGKGVDVILNSLAGEAILKNLNILRPFGRFLEIGKRDLYDNSRIGLRPFRNNLSYFGIDADTLLIERPALAQKMFNQVIDQFASGELKALPHQVLPVSRASEAFRAMQQSRHVGKLVVSMELDRPEDLHVMRAKNQVRPGGTYLVTGGLGGFGLSTAKWLIEQGADTLALVSRSGASREEAQQAMKAFERSGINARAFAADVADKAQVENLLATIRREMPPLIGVIHSAAVIEDAPIQNMDAVQLSNVFSAKMLGARNLHETTQTDPIEMFVLYSSISSVVGNPGQGAYVAANLYLDALAEHRRANGLPGLSVGWGAILDAGFLTRNENVREMLKSRTGLDATSADQALADLGRLSASGASRVSVARIDLSRLQQMLPTARSPRFEPILQNDATAALQADETLADLLKDIPQTEQRGFILERVVETTAKVLGTNASQVNPRQALGELGLDSLMAVELASALERDVGQSIPVMQLLGADSLTAVADDVAKILGVGDDDNQEIVSDLNQNAA
ncbi:MAG: SDR family NAD(P)-dependent oxidoreductase [Paracoccaceae bacterium]